MIHPFTDQRARLRRILENALQGALYDSSEREADGRVVVLHAHRSGGGPVTVTFRGVGDSQATQEPVAGASLHLRGVEVHRLGLTSLLGLFFPQMRSPGSGYARVRIEAGDARLDIVCQDAEWWEDEAPRA
ncbi:MAG TPA: hypothetical protein VI876_04145 [Dehalococcoidia bacterium]|nr:hypothetical protein [Dehalococcoidia bacterium]